MPTPRVTNQPPGMRRQFITSQGTSGPQSTPVPPQVQYVEDWFVYGINFLNLASGATGNGNIQIDADSDFKLVKLGLAAYDHSVLTDISFFTRTSPLVTMQIVDTGAGRNLFSTPIDVNAIWGNGQLPFILPVPRIFKARTNIAITVVNFDSALAYDLRFAFIGNKIFAQGINI